MRIPFLGLLSAGLNLFPWLHRFGHIVVTILAGAGTTLALSVYLLEGDSDEAPADSRGEPFRFLGDLRKNICWQLLL
jgi:hypothetical protein